MHILHTPEELFSRPCSIVLAAGFFDGLHLGHQLLLNQARDIAQKQNGESWALTFDAHPLSILSPNRTPVLLLTLEERLAKIAECQITGVLLLKFTAQFAQMSAIQFLDYLIPERVRSIGQQKTLLCGENWHFGSQAKGTPALAMEQGPKYGLDVQVVPYVSYQDEPISSTRVRLAIQNGQMTDVQAMLGRYWSIEGKIVQGHQRGRLLGVPTANVSYTGMILPPRGVYAVRVYTKSGACSAGVANFGVHPTFASLSMPQLEVHAFQPLAELCYGATARVELIAYIRPEISFGSAEELMTQMREDITVAQRLLAC